MNSGEIIVEETHQLKTGTTTICIMYKDGVILAADKRVTSGYLLSNKKFQKVFPITESIAVTVAGTVSDVQLLVKYIKAELTLKSLRTNREVTVKEATHLLGAFVYNNIRKYSIIAGVTHFIIGGKDSEGFHAYDLSPDGSIIPIEDYTASGSGSILALGVLETLYKPNMNQDEAIKLAVKSVNAAVQRDIASGNGVDVLTINKDGIKKAFSQELAYKLEA